MASSRKSRSEIPLAALAGSRVCVGFSGGLDSVVLLDALVRSRDALRITLTAVHVHHGLSPNADRWAAFCQSFCNARDVPLAIERVTVDRRSGSGIEAAALEQRYRAYAHQDADV